MFQLIKSIVPRDISRHWKLTINAVKWVPASQHPVTRFWPVPGHGSEVSLGLRQFLAGEKEEFNSTGISCSLSAGQRTVLDMFNLLLQKKPKWSAPASTVHGAMALCWITSVLAAAFLRFMYENPSQTILFLSISLWLRVWSLLLFPSMLRLYWFYWLPV